MSKEKVDNLSNLCVFIFECGEVAYSWKRFKIAIYALSQGSEIEPLKFQKIFSYTFKSACYAGPDDDDLRDDLDWLRDAEYITEKLVEIPGASKHNLYELTVKGKELALIAKENLTEEQRKVLTRVAKDFVKVEKYPVIELLAKYSSEREKLHHKRSKLLLAKEKRQA